MTNTMEYAAIKEKDDYSVRWVLERIKLLETRNMPTETKQTNLKKLDQDLVAYYAQYEKIIADLKKSK